VPNLAWVQNLLHNLVQRFEKTTTVPANGSKIGGDRSDAATRGSASRSGKRSEAAP
jgi:hypothetical protein